MGNNHCSEFLNCTAGSSAKKENENNPVHDPYRLDSNVSEMRSHRFINQTITCNVLKEIEARNRTDVIMMEIQPKSRRKQSIHSRKTLVEDN